jgi:hypothetical protein
MSTAYTVQTSETKLNVELKSGALSGTDGLKKCQLDASLAKVFTVDGVGNTLTEAALTSSGLSVSNGTKTLTVNVDGISSTGALSATLDLTTGSSAVTQAPLNNSTKVSTTQYVDRAISAIPAPATPSLQVVINVNDDLQGATPTNNQVIKYNGTNVVWSDIPAPTIPDGSITTAKLADSSVTTAKLANLSVTETRLADGSVNTSKIIAGSITDSKLNKAFIPLSGFGDPITTVSLGNQRIINLTNPISAQDGATKAYVDAITPITTAKLADNSVTTAKIVDGNVTDAKLNKIAIPLSGFGFPTATVSFGNQRLNELANPIATQDAATKAYVDSVIPSTANFATLSGVNTFTNVLPQIFNNGISLNDIVAAGLAATQNFFTTKTGGIINFSSGSTTNNMNGTYNFGSGTTTTTINGTATIGSGSGILTLNRPITPAYTYPVSAGTIGQIVSGALIPPDGQAYANLVAKVLTTFTLTPGIWLVSGSTIVNIPAGSLVTQLETWIENNTTADVYSFSCILNQQNSTASGKFISFPISVAIYVSATATFSQKVNITFTGTAPTVNNYQFKTQGVRIA